MTDPLVIAGAIASAPLVLDAYKRLLGPSIDVLGEGIKKGLVNRKSNIHKVAKRADMKANADSPGAIPSRVAAGVFEQAQWADDGFVAEYLSGVLASSRTFDGIDDRGVSWTAMVGRLSSDALRLHYVVYSALRAKLIGQDVEVISNWNVKQLVFTYIDLMPRINFGDGSQWMDRLIAAAYTLEREGLITQMTHGGAEHLTGFPYNNYQLPKIGDMLITATTVEGCRLFLQAHGHGDKWAAAIGSGRLSFDPWPDVTPEFANVPATWLDSLPPAER